VNRVLSPDRISTSKNHIRGLDGLRACAFLLVLAGHCGFSWIPNGFGVTVFFFLSGYLITTLLRKEWIQSDAISISRFYIRRSFRILPPLYCALLFAIVLAETGLMHSEIHWKGVIAAQFFMSNFSEALFGVSVPAGLSVLWSLAVEEHFYLVFPWLYLWFLRARVPRVRQVIILGGFCLLTLGWRLVLMTTLHAAWFRVYSFTDTRMDSILFGSIMAIAANPVIDGLNNVSRRRCLTATLISVLVLIVSIAMRGEVFRQTFRYTIQGIALFPIFFYVTRYADSSITRVLEWKVLRHVGDLSYSLYVVHYAVLFALTERIGGGPVKVFLLTLSVSYILALIMHRYVELPANRLRNRVLEMPRSRMVLQASTIDS
jgi:peptidoglycan/LPS O-acetylase OafA/YrhL